MDRVETAQRVKPSIKLNDIGFTPILIAIIAILVTFVILYLWKKKSYVRSDILLTGLCESGKTVLFGQIVGSALTETFTSIAENVADHKGENSSVRIVDIPGHERLRLRFYDQYKNTAKAIIYVIDSVTVQKDIRDVADFLYTVLADPVNESTPVLILCNKQDETLAKGSSVVKALLEKEINLLRTTRENQLQSVDNSASSHVYIGKPGKEFEFAHLSRTIQVSECAGEKGDLNIVTDFINHFC